MLLVADAQGLAEGQGALVDPLPELAHNGAICAAGRNGRHRSVLRALVRGSLNVRFA